MSQGAGKGEGLAGATDTAWNTEVRLWCSGSHHCQAEKQSHRAQLPLLTLPELTVSPRSCSHDCQVAEYITCNPENWSHRNIFPLSGRHKLQLIPGMSGDAEVRLWRSNSCHYWETKGTKAPAGLTQLTPPMVHHGYTSGHLGYQAQRWDFTDLELYYPITFPWGLVPWGQSNLVTAEMPKSSRNTGHSSLPSVIWEARAVQVFSSTTCASSPPTG